jgi:hypothetical protein
MSFFIASAKYTDMVSYSQQIQTKIMPPLHELPTKPVHPEVEDKLSQLAAVQAVDRRDAIAVSGYDVAVGANGEEGPMQPLRYLLLNEQSPDVLRELPEAQHPNGHC